MKICIIGSKVAYISNIICLVVEKNEVGQIDRRKTWDLKQSSLGRRIFKVKEYESGGKDNNSHYCQSNRLSFVHGKNICHHYITFLGQVQLDNLH
jgi:hypothetical protein